MRMIVLSALFAAGLGLAGTAPAAAAPVLNGLNNAATSSTLLEEVQYRHRPRVRCRSVTVCRRAYNGRRICRVERVCRRW